MTAPTSKRAMRQLSVREKIDAVQRVHEGESKASVARQIGVPESTLRGWCKNEMKLKTMDKSGCSQSPSPSPPLEKRPRVDGGSDNDFDDSVWFWIRNQQKHEESQRVINNNNHHQSSWFWKWYKEVGVQQQPSAFALLHNPDEPLPLVKRKKTKPSGGPGAVWGRRGADRVTNVRVSAGRLAVVKIRGSQAARPALTSISPSLAP
ncbi:hypothetical protein J6590_051555 [Homalodisca vitripennis]|nr:hypothetical protein J6590_051555 [Homalodisca vitripennis]